MSLYPVFTPFSLGKGGQQARQTDLILNLPVPPLTLYSYRYGTLPVVKCLNRFKHFSQFKHPHPLIFNYISTSCQHDVKSDNNFILIGNLYAKENLLSTCFVYLLVNSFSMYHSIVSS